jgi:hypothetical protein
MNLVFVKLNLKILNPCKAYNLVQFSTYFKIFYYQFCQISSMGNNQQNGETNKQVKKDNKNNLYLI